MIHYLETPKSLKYNKAVAMVGNNREDSKWRDGALKVYAAPRVHVIAP